MKRYNYSISNINYNYNSVHEKRYRRAKKLGTRDSQALKFEPIETEAYYKKERARKIERKFTIDTPVDMIVQQLVKEKFPDDRK